MKRSVRLSAGLALLVLSAAPVAITADGDPAPVEMTREQDHQHMMDLPGITELRPGMN